jgi:ketosteroid isomerase-like protein
VRLRAVPALVILLGVAAFSSSTCRAQLGNSAVLQVDNWRKAVLAGDSTILKSMYADNPRIFAPGQTPSNVKSAVDYWTSWKTRGLKALSVEINGQQEPQPGFHVLVIQLTLTVSENGATKKYYVKMGQGYVEKGAAWKIAAEQRDAETRLKGPAARKDLYPAGANAQQEIAEALQTAAKTRKRVMLVFGGNWCYDCHILDEAFHTPEISPTLNKYFVVVHVDVGEYNKNLELAKKYEVPLERGVPAAAILESDGKLLVSQKNQEFEKARSLAPEDILAFLNKWKPSAVR